MINDQKIGVGIVTYNRLAGLMKLVESLPQELIDTLIIVNDGTKYEELDQLDVCVHHNETNQGVGRSKNIALRHLQEAKVEHYFLIEDDIFIKDPSVFARYIELAAKTGIQHFNFSQHRIVNMDADRNPRPLFQVDYEDFVLPMFPCCMGAFSYYSRKCIEKVGLMDEIFYNSMEHMDHTYEVIKAGMHPSWHYFADLDKSEQYLGDEGWSDEQSTISGKPASRALMSVAAAHFKAKHGELPMNFPIPSQGAIINELTAIRRRYSSR